MPDFCAFADGNVVIDDGGFVGEVVIIDGGPVLLTEKGNWREPHTAADT